MSQWTHVAAVFRIDAFSRDLTSEKVEAIIGKELGFEPLDPSVAEDGYLPMGSEGTLKYAITVNPDVHALAAYTLTVYGDLRDYDSVEELETWFKKCVRGFALIRQAVCTIEVEGQQVVNITAISTSKGMEFDTRVIKSFSEERV